VRIDITRRSWRRKGEAVMQDYERYRAEYERLRDDLLQREPHGRADLAG
jgi:hypothetical protein